MNLETRKKWEANLETAIASNKELYAFLVDRKLEGRLVDISELDYEDFYELIVVEEIPVKLLANLFETTQTRINDFRNHHNLSDFDIRQMRANKSMQAGIKWIKEEHNEVLISKLNDYFDKEIEKDSDLKQYLTLINVEIISLIKRSVE